jgi:Tol biopolymer transport system component
VLVELRVTCVVAPEGTILVNRNQGVQQVSVATGASETAASSGKNGRWSTDGRQIAFAITRDNGSHVAVLTVGTGQVVELGGGTDPSWSPDGNQIVFVRTNGLYVMNADGSGVRLVLELTGIAGPAWSPDGAYIAFARTQSGTCSITILGPLPCPTDVHFVRPDGTGLTRLSSNGGRQPSWSPSGSHLAYVRGGGFLSPPPQLIRLDLATRVEQTLRSSANNLASPVWSPDGSYIAIAADLAEQGSDILLHPLGGGPAVTLHQPGATPTSWR